jgi:hypothetical protein
VPVSVLYTFDISILWGNDREPLSINLLEPILQQHPQERSTFLRPVASCQHRQFAVHRFRHIHAKGVIFSLAQARLFGQLSALRNRFATCCCCTLYIWNRLSTFSIGVYLGLILTQVALLIYGDRTTSPQRGQVRHKQGNGSGVRRSLEALLCHRKRGIPHHIVGGRPEQPGRE